MSENLIPWGKETDSHDLRSIDEIKRAREIFDSCNVCKTAARAISEEMLRSKLHFVFDNGKIDFDTATPYYLNRLVREITDSILQLGFFGYRVNIRGVKRKPSDNLTRKRKTAAPKLGKKADQRLETAPVTKASLEASPPRNVDANDSDAGGTKLSSGGDDGIRIEIAPVGSVYPVNNKGEIILKLVPGFYPEDPGGWTGIFVRQPIFSAQQDVRIVQSAVFDAETLIEQYNTLFANFYRRDIANSVNSVFATVNPALTNINGGSQTWFNGRTHDADAALAPQLTRRGDFREVIRSRADTIRALDHETSLLRNSNLGVSETGGSGEDDAVDSSGKSHVEHIVTDGRSVAECRALQSLSNSAHHCDRIETAIMFAMGHVRKVCHLTTGNPTF